MRGYSCLKGEELFRLLKVRGASVAVSATAKAVVCLELAASLTASTVDKNEVVRLSGLSRSNYARSSQTVARLLGVNSGVSISDLCISQSATQAKDLAVSILNKYELEASQNGVVDASLPLFQTAAVLAACKAMSIKVDKKRLYEASMSKRSLYDKVGQAMDKIAKTLHTQQNMKTNKKTTKTLLQMVEEKIQDNTISSSEHHASETQEEKETLTDFEEWKKKILSSSA
ncbi:origin recognition complex subunit 6 isoform X2 [Oratosquilla oratoria]|uniref:origin recognition complex subunit 6 isoform X2 n=1 Tax=Oratosquilla oratoria TaxID=337810 RepID=UPI003F764BC0